MSEATTTRTIWTSADLELLPDNGTRYEIIDGELFMTRAPHWRHQNACNKISTALDNWATETGLGRVLYTPGVLFSDIDNVIPDLIWISHERLEMLADEAGHLTGAPELVVEVLSPGATNERRDREAKLELYGQRGVREYWIVDWRLQQVEVYRRQEAQLQLVGNLLAEDTIDSPLLPGFECPVARFFE